MGDWPILGGSAFPALGNATATSSSSTHTKGSWAEIFSSCPFDTAAINIEVTIEDHGSNSLGSLFDIGVGAASSETVVIPNLMACNIMNQVDKKSGTFYSFPLCIPAGARISCRAQANASSHNIYLRVGLFPQRFTTQKPVRSIVAYGASTGTSLGTTITAGSGYVEMVASTARPLRELYAAWAPTVDGSAAMERYLAIGAAASEVDFSAFVGTKRAGDNNARIYTFPFVVPPGSRISAKCVTSSNYLILYGAEG